MGCFSWIAQNSNRSIVINGYGTRKYPSRTAYMWDNTGRRWKQHQYEGYGVFGGKDYFVLLAEMNREYAIEVGDDEKREDGIAIEYGNKINIFYPNITDCKEWTWRNEQPNHCNCQGFSNHDCHYDDMSSDDDDNYINNRSYTKIHKYDGWLNGEVKPVLTPRPRL